MRKKEPGTVLLDWEEISHLGPVYVSSAVIMYSIEDVQKMTGWGHKTVEKLFNDPKFPSVDFGRRKLVENHALMRYFSVRRERKRDRYWR